MIRCGNAHIHDYRPTMITGFYKCQCGAAQCEQTYVASFASYRTTVVNIRDSVYDFYIGRGSQWGNPFMIGKDGSRKEVIAKYREWLLAQPELLAQLHSLQGKRLGCYCKHPTKNVACHGDVLAKLANGEDSYAVR